jgi:cytochrome P450
MRELADPTSTWITSQVISKAGFGFPLSYPKEDTNKQGTIDFYQATRIMLAHFVPLTLLPRVPCSAVLRKLARADTSIRLQWCFSLTGSLRRMRTGSDVFDEAVISMIQGRRRSGTDGGERHDLLASLLKANGQETGSAALTDQELVSDVCIFLLAGHGSPSLSSSLPHH